MKLSTSFFLGLISALSLSACAQPVPTAPAKPADQTTAIVQPEPITNAPVGQKNNSSKKDMTPMIYPDNPSTGPAMTAAELQKKILALIASLQSRQDTNLPNVEKIMAAKLMEDPDSGGRFSMRGTVKEGWGYWYFVRKYDEEPASTLEFHLLHGEDVPDDALPKTCTLAFEPLAKELVVLGYERSDEIFQMRGRISWGFQKSVPSQNAIFNVIVYLYRVENGAVEDNFCIKQIGIGTDPIHE